ncbi:MAG: B12-binding domain-containing radical SAM protein [Candidatus Omnitrophica bacterium]|nr:B12-binding domain-containing radical SAM protein [Candidatus Omnitrophota bacterium]
MAMKICLIRPPILQLKSNFSFFGACLPIGLAYIAAIIRQEGHEVFVIDAAGSALERFEAIPSSLDSLTRQGLSPDDIVERIPPDSRIVGMTNMFLHEWPLLCEIAEKIKKRYPSMIIILGGENATAFWNRIFEETDAVDYCVLGEGEHKIIELIHALESGEATSSLPGVAAYKSGPSQAIPPSKRIQHIDALPRPAWDLIPVENYLAKKDAWGVHRGRSMPILATRGCPYACTFCSNASMWGNRYITRPPADVVDEIKTYVQSYNINNLNFCDLTSIIRKEWIREFCDILSQQPFSLTWQLPTGTRSEALDFETLRMMYKTGCRNIVLAPESGSERLLRVMKKNVKLANVLSAVRSACKAGMYVRINMIVGHPEETLRDQFQSLLFLIKAAWIGCQDAALMMFAPYPGSADTNKLIQEGRMTWGTDYYYSSLARSGKSSRTYNPRMGRQFLVFSQYFLCLMFYLTAYITRPWRLFFLIRNFFIGTENTQIDQLLRTKWHLLRTKDSGLALNNA